MLSRLSGRLARRAILALCLLTLACGNAPGGAPPTPVAGVNALPIASPTPRPLNAFQKILAAEKAGLIAHADSLVYRLYAAYDPASLPSQFRTAVAGKLSASLARLRAGTAVLADLRRHWAVLPAAVKARLQAYRQRPTNPDSFWAPVDITPQSVRLPGLAAPAKGRATFAYTDVPHTPVRVGYVKEHDGAQALARRLAAEIDASGMWAKEQQVLLGHTPCSDAGLADNGGSGHLDLYLVRPGKTVPRKDSEDEKGALPGAGEDYETYGLTIPQDFSGDCPSTDFLLLNENLGWDDLRTTTAHEMFHAFQDSFAQGDDGVDWWAEATATWTEDYIYPTLNSEQAQLEAGGWAKNSDALGPLDDFQDDGLTQYGAYIWPYYLTHRPGGDPGVIGKVYQSIADKRPIDVMHAWPDWEARFKEFALWNWNQDPVDVYRDGGAHIDPLAQSTHYLATGGVLALADGAYDAAVSLREASITYYTLRRIDDGSDAGDVIHQLRIGMSELAHQGGAGVQAIITIEAAGQPARRYTEDWSGLTSKTFCRDQAAEHITSLVLVVTNSNVTTQDKLNGTISVVAQSELCN
ncbi:MAG TPA: hypothetical protein VM536_06160 [Chloroflexia bacterium]|nr:hypothetical protein [Chloroflexia bacterium]